MSSVNGQIGGAIGRNRYINMDNHHLTHACVELVEAMDKTADNALPREIADVVKLHSKLAVGSAWLPVPGADVAAGAANIWTMYLRINNKIGLKLGESILKTIASAVATNLASYTAMSAIGSALKFIPGLGTIGGGIVLSVGLYAVTLTSGVVYLKALTAMLKKDHVVDGDKLKNAVNDFIKDNKSEIKSIMEEAKKTYKEEKK